MPRYPALSGAANGLSSRVYTGLSGLAQTHANEVYALNVGDTYLLPPPCARAESQRVDDVPRLHNYADVRGEPRLLDAIEADLAERGRPVPRHELQITAGATSGLDLACRVLLAPGDEVIVLAPFWPLIRGIVSACGAVPIELPFFTELRGADFDVRAELERVVSPRTVALYVNTPHNPTGVVLSAPELDAIAAFASDHDLWVLSDEAYEQLWFGEAPAPLWQNPLLRERTVVAHTLSKSYGLAGARVGFVHAPEATISALSGLQTFATYCAARPMQIAAARALSEPEGKAWVAEARRLYAEAARKAADAVGVSAPESGTFLYFDTRPFLRAGETPLQLLERCAKAGVVLTEGRATGKHYTDWARMCFTAIAPDALDRALSALKHVLADR